MEVRVGIADMNITHNPGKLVTIGLGSCIGISLYDKRTGVAGLAHIMLPESDGFSNISNPLKFADLAIPLLIERMVTEGASKNNLVAKIAGGASMFNFVDKSVNLDIGERNGKSVIKALEREGIPLASMDIGGNKGRTMIVDAFDGKVSVRIIGLGTKEI